jgi:hypothetical protein
LLVLGVKFAHVFFAISPVLGHIISTSAFQGLAYLALVTLVVKTGSPGKAAGRSGYLCSCSFEGATHQCPTDGFESDINPMAAIIALIPVASCGARRHDSGAFR